MVTKWWPCWISLCIKIRVLAIGYIYWKFHKYLIFILIKLIAFFFAEWFCFFNLFLIERPSSAQFLRNHIHVFIDFSIFCYPNALFDAIYTTTQCVIHYYTKYNYIQTLETALQHGNESNIIIEWLFWHWKPIYGISALRNRNWTNDSLITSTGVHNMLVIIYRS